MCIDCLTVQWANHFTVKDLLQTLYPMAKQHKQFRRGFDALW